MIGRIKHMVYYYGCFFSGLTPLYHIQKRFIIKKLGLNIQIEDLLFDPNRDVRTTAARILSRHGDESQVTNLENLIVRDPITERYITPLIARLKGQEPASEPTLSIKHELLEIRDRLDKLIKAKQD